ncbi:MAG: hypothetical protein HY927_09465 [Elusimicrobia bacterium]|nr:hypothetical protein [Elusimicrobiota bacterium]
MREDAWRRFLLPEELSRHKFSAFVPRHPTVDIMHGDLECRYTFPVVDGRTVTFLNFPWREANRSTVPAPYSVLTTDLRERDVVCGGLPKAAAALGSAKAGAQAGAVVLLNSGCVPDLTGEDLSPLVARTDPERPVFYHPSNGKDMAPVIVGEMARLARPLRGLRAARAGSVNLIGYPAGRCGQELVELLAEAGVRVEACLVPDISPASIRRGWRAGLQVVMPDAALEGVYDELLKTMGIPAVRPPAPYGLEATGAWLAAVCRAAGGKPAGARRALLRHRRSWGSWRDMKAEARGFRLGFVLDVPALRRLSDPSWHVGIPVVAALKEMGFGLDFLVFGGAEAVGGAKRHRLHLFRSPAELAGKLAKLPARAFYSDCFFDSRLSRRGKAQFSLATFEPGIAGGLRTLERLLGICRLPFYGRYGRYLLAGAGGRA